MYHERLASSELEEDTSDRLAGMYWSVCRDNTRLRAENGCLRAENGCLRQTVTYYRSKRKGPRPDMTQWAVFWSVAGVAVYAGIMAVTGGWLMWR